MAPVIIHDLAFHSLSVADAARNMSWVKQGTVGEEMHWSCSKTPRPVINAMRRAVFADVPTMRFDDGFVQAKDTNVIIDNLEHQIGCIPIRCRSDLFLYENQSAPPASWNPVYEPYHVLVERVGHGIMTRPGKPEISEFMDTPPKIDTLDEFTTLVFELDVECKFDEASKQLVNEVVYGRHIQWIPLGDQLNRLLEANSVPYIQPDLPIAELREGERIHHVMHALKGQPSEHGKWRGANAYFRIAQESAYQQDITKDYRWTIRSIDGNPATFYHDQALRSLVSRFQTLADNVASETALYSQHFTNNAEREPVVDKNLMSTSVLTPKTYIDHVAERYLCMLTTGERQQVVNCLISHLTQQDSPQKLDQMRGQRSEWSSSTLSAMEQLLVKNGDSSTSRMSRVISSFVDAVVLLETNKRSRKQ